MAFLGKKSCKNEFSHLLGFFRYEMHFFSFILYPFKWFSSGFFLSYTRSSSGKSISSSLIRKVEVDKSIHVIRICRRACPISHLFFGDDSIIFSRASMHEIIRIKQILHNYEVASGQKINFKKSKLSFSHNVPDQMKNLLNQEMGVQTVKQHSKYLGLPTIIGRSKK